jgi:energy-coupling factor transporter ATP-binding protein EcfA2
MEGRGVTAQPSPSPEAERADAQSPPGAAPRASDVPVVVPAPPTEAGAPSAPAARGPADGSEQDSGEQAPSEQVPGEQAAAGQVPGEQAAAGQVPGESSWAGQQVPSEQAAAEPGGAAQPAGEQGGADQAAAGQAPGQLAPVELSPGAQWGSGQDSSERGASGSFPLPRVRVDARLLEATLLNLRKRVAAIPLVFDIPGADEITVERGKILSQVDDYLLPRVRQSAAPILVALVGSTGAGKSTLVNSIVGTQISQTGVRRPTTNSPVLACHPADMHWFAENMFLPTLPRVRQEGLARPGRDGLLVLAASETMPRGYALLDTPDIDSVAYAHRDFAYQFLDAADLWLFMTSSNRYADAPVWEILQHARERGAALGVVLSRVPRTQQTELVSHFNAMLDANGITPANRFVIPDSAIVDSMLPPEVFQPIKDWLTETAQREDRRVAVLSQTMAGVLDTFKIRVPKLAAHVEAQVALRMRLRHLAESEYASALTAFDAGARGAALLRGEVLARWQDCADSGDLGTALATRQPRKGKRARKGIGNTRIAALDAALRAAVEALVVSVADQAAEKVSAAWRADSVGASLLAGIEASRARDEKAEREFASAFGSESEVWAATVAAGFKARGSDPAGTQAKGLAGSGTEASENPVAGTTAGGVAGAGAGGVAGAGAGGLAGAGTGTDAVERRSNTLDRSSSDLPAHAVRAVSAWQDQLMRMVAAANQANRVAHRGGHGQADHGSEPLSLLALIAVFGDGASFASGGETTGEAAHGGAGEEIIVVPRDVLAQSFGASKVDSLLASARADLVDRVRLLLDEELLRFFQVLDAVGQIDPVAAMRLYQAEYNLEAVR